ncbi:uncharacterized protein LOC128191234 [Crassostrea angulata]|uniref:uncharacterized protein LOC128191234 n=1 Tax=Magallana angulata TaxID=2784310 RepID=UPI0022B1200B|nr:uncharacterized protein LOC128191234 [Crassostrea angulata]
MAFQMLPNLQFLDLSENKGLHSSNKLHSAFLGLQNSALTEIRLTKLRLNNLFEDFFLYLRNTSLERVFFDDNIITSNIGDVMSPLSSHLREISFKGNQISKVSFNKTMPYMEVVTLSNNKLLSVPDCCNIGTSRPSCPNLRELDLSDNLTSVVYGGKLFRQCLPRIQRLFLGYNKIKTLGKNFISLLPYLVYLSIENLDPQCIPCEFSLNSSSLQYLYMGDKNKDLRYNPHLFNYTRNLKLLDMTGLQFVLSHKKTGKQLFELFKSLTRLEELILKRTSLSTFPATLFPRHAKINKTVLTRLFFQRNKPKKVICSSIFKGSTTRQQLDNQCIRK